MDIFNVEEKRLTTTGQNILNNIRSDLTGAAYATDDNGKDIFNDQEQELIFAAVDAMERIVNKWGKR